MSAINLIILGIIRERPQSAYDLQKEVIYRNISKWVKISSPSVYKKVIKLQEDGYIEAKTYREGNAPEKSVYYITEQGKEYQKELMEKISNKSVNIFLDMNSVIINLEYFSLEEQNEFLDNISKEINILKDTVNDNVMRKNHIPVTGKKILEQQVNLVNSLEEWINNFKSDVNKMTDLECAIFDIKNSSSNLEIEKMRKMGISTDHAVGVSITMLRSIAKKYYPNHKLALSLWDSNLHEAKILAVMIDEPSKVSLKQISKWASQFDSWDICDLTCRILIEKTEYVELLINRWSKCKKEYLKRASFVLIARQAKMNRSLSNQEFEKYLSILLENSSDERNIVMKGNAWALRQIGKRNAYLKNSALVIANQMNKKNDASSLWISRNYYSELKIDSKLKNSFRKTD